MPNYSVVTIISFHNVTANDAEHAREICEHHLLPSDRDADILTSKAFRQPTIVDPPPT